MAKYDGERSHHAAVFSFPHPEVGVADGGRNKTKTDLHSQVLRWQETSKCFTSPGPGGKTSTCSTLDKSSVVQRNCKWHQQIPPGGVFLGHRQPRPCRWLEQGRPIHIGQSGDGSLIWKGNVGGRKREGTGCEKSSCCVCCTVSGCRGTQWPSRYHRRSHQDISHKNCCQTKFIEITHW